MKRERLDVQVELGRRRMGDGPEHDVVLVSCRSLGAETARLVGCAILLPTGLRLLSEGVLASYPFDLAPGDTCVDGFDCHHVARQLAQVGEAGTVSITAAFFQAFPRPQPLGMEVPWAQWEPAPFGYQQRSRPLGFDVRRWL